MQRAGGKLDREDLLALKSSRQIKGKIDQKISELKNNASFSGSETWLKKIVTVLLDIILNGLVLHQVDLCQKRLLRVYLMKSTTPQKLKPST